MTRFSLVIKSFIYYFKANLLVTAGVAISTAVLTGALIIGDSVTYSLEKSASYRLGHTTHVVSAVDRYFRTELASELAQKGGFDVAPALILEGMAIAAGGEERINKVQFTGIDHQFDKIAGSPLFGDLKENEVIVSVNLAERLHLKKGDFFQARIKKASLIPLNAPFVSDEQTSISFSAVVKEIADQHMMGLFNLKNSQTAPYNLFLSLAMLNKLMDFDSKANHLLISTDENTNKHIIDLLGQVFTPEDAGLKVKEIPLTHEIEITSERVFIDDQLIKAFEPFRDAHPVLTYFANSLRLNNLATPYSFVSTIDDNSLLNNEIIINRWLADDLNAQVGDSLTMLYYEIGPLRQLIEKSSLFVIKGIVAIEGKYADKDLMPLLPGMSDAGNCRDWDTGIPIELGSIRDKDEDYWDQYKGTPKAFISLNKAHQLWSNRFGNYTAIRVDKASFSDDQYRRLFSAAVKPGQLGIMVTPVKEEGLNAARNGVDFSQLFLGLSFFLLVAAFMLTALLFLLNLGSRQSQTGTLLMIGFTRSQIRNILLSEALLIAFVGGLAGLGLAVIYTRLIFAALNTLWWEVVRTSVLEVNILPVTLLSGLLISLFIALLTILWSVNRSFKQRAVALQRRQDQPEKLWLKRIKKLLMFSFLVIAIGLILFQLVHSNRLSPTLFFITGGLLLIGLLLFADYSFRKYRHQRQTDFSLNLLNQRDKSQNLGRSMSIIILFALGTFLVVSTGANRVGLLTDSTEKRSGTGGFKFFAETSVPVLYNLNDTNRRLKEGLTTGFSAAQFSKMSGDDASCLNLNRVSNPAILGADPNLLKGRFGFAVKSDQANTGDVWEALNDFPEGGVVPAIADQTVIQWGLGLSVGDTLLYRNEVGDTLRLRLVAGLSPSVFQGYVLISQTAFLKNYPTSSGSNLFLIDVAEEQAVATADELRNIFRDYGWEMTTAAERLMEFNSVTNTYLSIFLALGALGLILGTVGLAVVLARTLLERKNELILMQSLGFTRRKIGRLLVLEYVDLLLWGILIGFVAAIVAVLPNFLAPGNEVSLFSLLFMVLVILGNGILWILGLTWFRLRTTRLVVNSLS